MVEQRRGLGRGLSALLDEVDAPIAEGGAAVGLIEIPIDVIRPNPNQPRRHFGEVELEELCQSIREKGVLQPILVRPSMYAGQYEIVAGERRWRAAQRTGVRVIPALVRSLSDVEVLEIAIVENVQRADLSPIEEAEGYRALMDRFGRTQAQVAETVGKSRVHIANALRLMQLPEAVQTMLREGKITVRQAESLARGRSGGGPSRREEKDSNTLSLESDLGEALGMTVEIRHQGAAGELRLHYASLEQLDDLCRRLMRG